MNDACHLTDKTFYGGVSNVAAITVGSRKILDPVLSRELKGRTFWVDFEIHHHQAERVFEWAAATRRRLASLMLKKQPFFLPFWHIFLNSLFYIQVILLTHCTSNDRVIKTVIIKTSDSTLSFALKITNFQFQFTRNKVSELKMFSGNDITISLWNYIGLWKQFLKKTTISDSLKVSSSIFRFYGACLKWHELFAPSLTVNRGVVYSPKKPGSKKETSSRRTIRRDAGRVVV